MVRARVVHAGILPLLAACSFDGSGLGAASEDVEDASPDLDPDGAGADAPPPVDAAPAVALRVNAGGTEHEGSDYPGTWEADQGACDNSDWTEFGEISGTDDDPLFESYRFGAPGESINCQLGDNLATGTYEVTLLFGEVWYGAGCRGGDEDGARVFDVGIEGQTRESEINTVAEGGCCHEDADSPGAPFTRSYEVTVEDGTVDVTLQASEGDSAAMVSAIQVLSAF